MALKITNFVRKFEKQLNNMCFPEGFFDSFEFSELENGYNHPFTVEVITKVLRGSMGMKWFGLEYRGFKKYFRPDITVFKRKNKKLFEPILIIDYESPNSSDARVIEKDILKYLKSMELSSPNQYIPYWIITSLPNKPLDWKLKYTRKNYYNFGFSKDEDEIKNNPMDYWYDYYKNEIFGRKGEKFFTNEFGKLFKPEFRKSKLKFIKFININQNSKRIKVSRKNLT